jgi:hypothetical protein
MAGKGALLRVKRERTGCANQRNRKTIIRNASIDPTLNQRSDIDQNKLVEHRRVYRNGV